MLVRWIAALVAFLLVAFVAWELRTHPIEEWPADDLLGLVERVRGGHRPYCPPFVTGLLDDLNGAEPAPQKASAPAFYDDDPATPDSHDDDDFGAEAPFVGTHPAYDDDMRAAYGYQAANGAVGETADFEAGDYGYDHEPAEAASRNAGERMPLAMLVMSRTEAFALDKSQPNLLSNYEPGPPLNANVTGRVVGSASSSV